MKLFIFSILIGLNLSCYTQTVTTTTINGSLRVNDSLNVSNNLEAADITSRGEMVAKDVMRAEKDIFVEGNAAINGNLDVKGLSNLQAGVITPELLLGSATNHIKITAISSGNANRIYFGPHVNQSSNMTCIPPYNYGTAIFPDRITIPSNSPANIDNQLDFRNDGLSGFIEFGHNSTGNPPGPQMRQGSPVINTTWPTLKMNSLCNGNVEIAFGGGTLSTGKFFEVGFPDRDFTVASNVFANGIKTGQRTTTLHPLNAVPGYTLYNTQLVVNTAITRALSVLNNGTNALGDEVFTVFGNGKTQINASTLGGKYFLINDVSNSSSVKERFIVYGNGSTEINSTAADAFVVKDGSINGTINFKVKNNGHIFAREMQIQAPNMTFPDYVFDKDYKRLNLEELDAYITTERHLPGFEKAEYYETNGIVASEMFVKQQEKIEELTLYLIELKKEIEELKKKASDH
jgi:hypothetical protein